MFYMVGRTRGRARIGDPEHAVLLGRWAVAGTKR